MRDGWDVIVVGAGAAGSALAARLSENPDRRVLVLEAGRVPTDVAGFGSALLDAARVPGADPRTEEVWRYPVRLTSDRDYTVLRGRMLGGSMAVNGGYFIRPRRIDLERWAEAGGDAWRYPNVLPVLRRMERDLDYGASALHGDAGPIPVSRPRADDAWSRAFADAARSMGHVDEVDKNAEGPIGVGPVPMNVADGVRWNAGAAYLLPAMGRSNLEVRGDENVHRIRIENGRAVGVEVVRAGRVELIEAGEVVLCAGAFGSAALLFRSGVGPADALTSAGVEVVADSPVGTSFADHPQVIVEAARSAPLEVSERWLSHALNLRTEHRGEAGEAEILQSSTPLAVLAGDDSDGAELPLPLLVSLQVSRSRGTLRLDPRDPNGPPIIDYQYLSEQADRAGLRDAVRIAAGLLASDAMQDVGVRNAEPALLDSDDDRLDSWIGARLGTSVHASATAPMGSESDPAAVVDGSGRVHGVTGLRVADTSILPDTPRRGPAASAVLVGEVIARAMR
ncbi:mycofactocin system GMC family oxidoreductase MftG [Herbiconiux sp. L3-i23]|uniref:mycofactocin dehydrogenase MftG n=1 Tax=Herbiconiux sp. L3-i23 TaxID=2905871 RepID=UPI00206E6998|nr:mycofactocin system GMC family oxidoreductase MftG [Herbiconiux sp. L3-i23]BDI22514.1 dehydrogenase [Herbiconiux sp. L3-i23]